MSVHSVIAHSDVRCADMVAIDLLIYPKHSICIHVPVYKHNAGFNPHEACTQVDWKFMALVCKGSVIKPSTAGKLGVYMLGPAVVQRYEERSAHWN